MHNMLAGLAALFAVAFFQPALAESMTEEIQETEEPGSEFELDVDSGGKVEFGRKGELDAGGGTPLEIGEGDDSIPLEPLEDPDAPVDSDPIDEELPGEGPESLSGPDDDDPLPE